MTVRGREIEQTRKSVGTTEIDSVASVCAEQEKMDELVSDRDMQSVIK